MITRRGSPPFPLEKYPSTCRPGTEGPISDGLNAKVPHPDDPIRIFFDDDFENSHPFGGFAAFME